MMVQNTLPEQSSFVCTMAEHNDFCGQFARAFGNDAFESVTPRVEMLYVVSHHDYGWNDWDAAPGLDPKTRLPAGLSSTPSVVTITANTKSPDINEEHHPYCGLIASMHSWGLFNARYGYSDFRVRPGGSTSAPLPKDNANASQTFLDGEQERQSRLGAALAARSETQWLVEESHLFQNYKQLQFFDTLALYFNLRHETERGEEIYTHVPLSATKDVNVKVMPRGNGVYAFDPFPFGGDRLEVSCLGRYVEPFSEGNQLTREEIGLALRNLPTTTQDFVFVAA